MSTPTALDRAIEFAGTQLALATLLDIASPSITGWKKSGVPPIRCTQIETLTDGQVTRYELRPDVFGPAPAATAAVTSSAVEGDDVHVVPFVDPA